MLSTKKAFTLVELIVVITILAVLGTIAFISLQGYSWDARNTKRTSDLGNIASAITTKSAQWVPLVSFLDGTAITNNIVPAATLVLAWSGAVTIPGEYNVTAPNYIALWVKEEDFKDPNDKPYPLAITTKIRGKYELAASMEDGAGWFIAKIAWTYNPRADTTLVDIVSVDLVNHLVVLDNSSAGFFQRGDELHDDAGTPVPYIIKKIAMDGVTITLEDSKALADTNTLALLTSESASLIYDVVNTDFVTDWNEILPY